MAASSASGPPAIFPSGPTVPENLLRIEVRLGQPLRMPLKMETVHLLDEHGEQIDDAFLDLPLLSGDGRRVTLLLHPGRVKSGVGPNVRLGRALRAGSTVSLAVDDPGLALHVKKSWQVTGPAVTAPVPANWTLDVPPSGGRVPLTVHLIKPVSPTAETLIAVRGATGTRIEGVAWLADGETTWRFIPSKPWRPGRFALMTNPDLEDVAGNRPCALFEVGLFGDAMCDKGTSTAFTIQPRAHRQTAHDHRPVGEP